MADVSMGELLARSAVSLAVVLALVLGAYVIMRRRVSGEVRARRPTGGSRLRARSMTGVAARSDRGGRIARNGLRVVGRAGVGRTASVTAVQFGERVLLIGAADHGAPTVLAELDGAVWAQCTDSVRQLAIPTTAAGDPDVGHEHAQRGLLDTLREATTRRA